MTKWGEGFAEGDGGVPEPGEATRIWNKIYQAKLEAEAKPIRLKPARISELQAKAVTIFLNEENIVADRLRALELAMKISNQFADELALEEHGLTDTGKPRP